LLRCGFFRTLGPFGTETLGSDRGHAGLLFERDALR
jgi:hypothetical protein